MTDVGRLGEPDEIVALRRRAQAAEGRISQAQGKLKAASLLEGRLEALLRSDDFPETLIAMSPEREALEAEATAIVLEAELGAAGMLRSLTPSAGSAGNGPQLRPDLAADLACEVEALAQVERDLVRLGRRALRVTLAVEPAYGGSSGEGAASESGSTSTVSPHPPRTGTAVPTHRENESQYEQEDEPGERLD